MVNAGTSPGALSSDVRSGGRSARESELGRRSPGGASAALAAAAPRSKDARRTFFALARSSGVIFIWSRTSSQGIALMTWSR